MRAAAFVLALLLAAPAAGSGNVAAPPEPPASFRHLSLEQGLSQAAVRALFQDSKGFLWVATEDGLNRYDGYGFTVFRNDPLDPDSLPDNGQASFAEGKGNVLWIGTIDRGIARLDLSTLRFERFLPDPQRAGGLPAGPVAAILEDRSGILWAGVGGGGLLRLAPGGSSFEAFRPEPGKPGGFPAAVVLALAEDAEGALWVGTVGQGVLKVDARDGRVLEAFNRDPEDPSRTANAVVTDVLVDRAGRVWAAAGPLARIDPVTREVRVYRHDPSDPASFPSRQARRLAEDADGRIWIATENGLVRLDPRTEVFTTFRNRPDDASSLPSNRTNTVLVDRSGLLWTGLDGSGLAVLDLSGSPFRTHRYQAGRPDGLTAPIVRGVHEAPDGTLWMGLSGGGLNALDPATGRVRAFRAGPPPAGLSSDDVWNVTTDEEGIAWAATLGGGLNRVDPRTGAVRVFRAVRGPPGSLSSDQLRVVLEGRDGGLWIGTAGGGLCRFDRRAERFDCFRNDPNDPTSLSSNVVRAVHEGPSGTLWAGTDRGINRLDRSTGRFTRFLDDPSRPETAGIARVYGLWEAPDGILWAGTPRGLVRLDPATGAVRRYRQADGLPNESVYSILADDTGSLWVSTNRGLARVTPTADGKGASFRAFDALDGLQSDEFNGGSFHRGPSGTLWFGGILGVTGVAPGEVRDDPFAPPVALLSFSKLGRPLPASEWLRSGAVVLGPREGFFSVEFAALAFRAAAKNRYAWKLEGLDEEWVDAGTRRRADYTSVPPGRYVFRVKAANKDGVWNEEGASLTVVVKPPWWKTPVATGAWVLLLAAGGVVVSRLEKRRVLGKERERSQLVEAELRAHAAEAQARAVQAVAARKTAELEEARAMQLSLLPRETPRVPGFEVAALTRTATEVGGDTWDWAVGPDGALALVIGDATGHGVRAGTVVSVMKGLFRGDPFPGDLGLFLDRAGRVLRDLGLPRLHMALAVLVVRGGEATLASAGMPPAWVFRTASGDVEEVLVPGAPLGALVDTPHSSASFRLEPGDVVLLSSDGLAESAGPDGEPLGYSRARALFRTVATLPPGEALAALSRHEEEWRGGSPREDDLTLVLLRRER
jgi:ligand-binding sensor domain-containing protein/serine phosphatase RsbU (regulator of sigma subunit)